MSNEYNDLVVAELEEVSAKVIDILKQETSFNKRGVGALLLTAASMCDQMQGDYDSTKTDARATAECLQLLSEYPGAMALLLGQLGKAFGLAHMRNMAKEHP